MRPAEKRCNQLRCSEGAFIGVVRWTEPQIWTEAPYNAQLRKQSQLRKSYINRMVSGWVAGNIVFGGLIGLAIDAASGGMYKLSPEQVDARLDGERAGRNRTFQTEEGAIFITVVLKPDPEWEQVGSLTSSQSK